MENKWLFEIFFTQISNIANHYQYLVVLIIGASSFIYSYAHNCWAKIFASISFLLSSANLIIGLLIYSAILNIIFDLTISPDKANLTDPTLKCYFTSQLIIGIVSFIFLLVAAFKFKPKRTSNESH